MTKEKLQAAMEAARAGRRRAKLSAELKTAVAAYCLQRRAAGAPWKELATELSVGANQLRVWSRASQSNRSKLRRVRVVGAPGSAANAGLCLELPGSARVTGLSVADVAALLRELR
jgi:transposase-like protein